MRDVGVQSAMMKNIAVRSVRRQMKETSAELPANAVTPAAVDFLNLQT